MPGMSPGYSPRRRQGRSFAKRRCPGPSAQSPEWDQAATRHFENSGNVIQSTICSACSRHNPTAGKCCNARHNWRTSSPQAPGSPPARRGSVRGVPFWPFVRPSFTAALVDILSTSAILLPGGGQVAVTGSHAGHPAPVAAIPAGRSGRRFFHRAGARGPGYFLHHLFIRAVGKIIHASPSPPFSSSSPSYHGGSSSGSAPYSSPS